MRRLCLSGVWRWWRSWRVWPLSNLPNLRRCIYLLHRWAGVAGCLLMVLWFVSGVVMLFVGYPKLTTWDRLQHLPTLDRHLPYLAPTQLAGIDHSHLQRLVLQAADGHPYYVRQRADGK